jgi:phosphatidylglycerophosphatase A
VILDDLIAGVYAILLLVALASGLDMAGIAL